jgi:hypothetical protein
MGALLPMHHDVMIQPGQSVPSDLPLVFLVSKKGNAQLCVNVERVFFHMALIPSQGMERKGGRIMDGDGVLPFFIGSSSR